MDSIVLDSTHISVRGEVERFKIDTFIGSDVDFIGNVLTQQALVFVKPASGTALSTVSIRGGTPEQTAVYWNGISLQNTLNGNVDLNLLPAMVFDEVNVNNTNSVRTGSGGTAGNVELNNAKIDTSNTLKFNTGFGSFNTLNASFKATVINKKNRLSILSYVQKSDNNYPMNSVFSSGPKRLENAEYLMAGTLYQQEFSIKNNNPIHIRFWAQNAQRNIPATLLESESKKNQIDRSVRFQSDWSKLFDKTEMKIIAGSFIESLAYNDSVSEIYTTYGFINNTALVHLKRKFDKHIQAGLDIELRHFGADADTFYAQSRVEVSEGAHLKLKLNKWQGHFGTRFVQFTNTTDLPILYAVHVNRKISNKWSVLGSFITNYRLPTFNSLFWRPGGNPDLIAEKSTNAELSTQLKTSHVSVLATVFSNDIYDQIRWLPGKSGVFEAQQVLNQLQWNRGVEITAKTQYKKLQLDGGATKLISTVKKDKTKKQQSYVPMHQGYINAGYIHRRWQVRYGIQWVSKRFIDTENTEFVPAYLLHQVQAQFGYKSFKINVIARNLANLDYTVLPFRPNPPRNYQIDISYTINKHKTQ